LEAMALKLGDDLIGGSVVALFVSGQESIATQHRIKEVRVVDDDTPNSQPPHLWNKVTDVEMLDRIATYGGVSRPSSQRRGIDTLLDGLDLRYLAGNLKRGIVDIERHDVKPRVDGDAAELTETAPAIDDTSPYDPVQHFAVHGRHQPSVAASQIFHDALSLEVMDYMPLEQGVSGRRDQVRGRVTTH